MLIKDVIRNILEEIEQDKKLERETARKITKKQIRNILVRVLLGFLFVLITGVVIAVDVLLILKYNTLYPKWISILSIVFMSTLAATPLFTLGYMIAKNDEEVDVDADNR